MLFEVLIALLGIPTGFLISFMARDELLVGRKYFIYLMILCVVCCAIFFNNLAAILTCAFIFLVAGISYLKSFDKMWTKKR